jgi:hypothetical protein
MKTASSTRRQQTAHKGPLSENEARKIIDGFDEAQRRVYEQVVKYDHGQKLSDLHSAWYIGQILMTVEAGKRGHGKNFIRNMARLLGYEPSFLYRRKLFFERFPDDGDYARLTGLRLPSGEPLTFTHANLVLDLEDDERWVFLELAASHGLNSTALRKEVRKFRTGNDQERRPGGRPPSVPADVEGKLAQVDETLPLFRKRAQSWGSDEHGLIPALKKLAAERIKPGWVRMIEHQLQELDDLTVALAAVQEAWQEARQYLLKQLKQSSARNNDDEPDTEESSADDQVLNNLFRRLA